MDGKPQWEEFDHPADLGITVRGSSLAEMLENAGNGMVSLMVDPESVREEKTRDVVVGGIDRETLLVHWLQEILFAFDAEHFVAARAEVLDLSNEDQLTGCIHGETLDMDRHRTRHEIKAVTWHNLDVRRTDQGYHVNILFDV